MLHWHCYVVISNLSVDFHWQHSAEDATPICLDTCLRAENRYHKKQNTPSLNMARLGEHGIRLSSVRIYIFFIICVGMCVLCLINVKNGSWQVRRIFVFLFKMSPSFLNSNSTSHTWPFSAVAELIGKQVMLSRITLKLGRRLLRGPVHLLPRCATTFHGLTSWSPPRCGAWSGLCVQASRQEAI